MNGTEFNVLFDGTASRDWGRQLFVPVEIPQQHPLILAKAPHEHRDKCHHESLQQQALQHLLACDLTLTELAAMLRVRQAKAAAVLTKLRALDAVDIVGSTPNPQSGQKGQRRWICVYGVRT